MAMSSPSPKRMSVGQIRPAMTSMAGLLRYLKD